MRINHGKHRQQFQEVRVHSAVFAVSFINKKRERETVDYQQLRNFSSFMLYETIIKRQEVYKKTFQAERIIYRQKLHNVSI